LKQEQQKQEETGCPGTGAKGLLKRLRPLRLPRNNKAEGQADAQKQAGRHKPSERSEKKQRLTKAAAAQRARIGRICGRRSRRYERPPRRLPAADAAQEASQPIEAAKTTGCGRTAKKAGGAA